MLEQAERKKGSKSSAQESGVSQERKCREIFKIMEKVALFNRFSPLLLIQGDLIKMVDYNFRK